MPTLLGRSRIAQLNPVALDHDRQMYSLSQESDDPSDGVSECLPTDIGRGYTTHALRTGEIITAKILLAEMAGRSFLGMAHWH